MSHLCPQVETEDENGIVEIMHCDNCCRTIFCAVCDKEYYEDGDTLRGGHDPSCGVSSDESIIDDGVSSDESIIDDGVSSDESIIDESM